MKVSDKLEQLRRVLILLQEEADSMLKKIEQNDRSLWRAGVKNAGINKRVKEARVMVELAKTVESMLRRGVL